MYFGMSLTMNELFNYEHTQSIKGCTPEKEEVAMNPEIENKVILELRLIQTLQNTTGLTLRHVTKNQLVYPNGRKENSYQFLFFVK